MQFTIETKTLKNLIKRCSGLAKADNLMLTQLTGVKVLDGKISLTTTDSYNFIKAIGNVANGDNFEFVIKTEIFNNIISKTTSDYVTIQLSGTNIIYKGNGTYTIELPLNEESNLIKFPVYDNGFMDEPTGTISLVAIHDIVTYNKPALATTPTHPHLTGYLCDGDFVVSSDRYNACISKVKTFDTKILLNPVTFDILSKCTTDNIMYYIADNRIMFKTPELELCSMMLGGIEKYPDLTTKFNSIPFTSDVVVSKVDVLNAINRLSLFVTPYETRGVFVDFTENGLNIYCAKTNAEETVTYKSANSFKPYKCFVEIDMFCRQISARSGDNINIHYGNDLMLKMVDKDIIQYSALLEMPNNG